MWKVVLASVILTANAGAVSAATLDFNELGENELIRGNAQTINGATLSTDGDAFVVGDQFENSICAANTVVASCANDLLIDFTDAVVDLKFEVTGFNDDDFVALRVFGALNEPLGTINILDNGLISLASFGAVGSLSFDDQAGANGKGLTYRDFNFEVAAVPLPASALLLLGALGGLGALARRKRLSA